MTRQTFTPCARGPGGVPCGDAAGCTACRLQRDHPERFRGYVPPPGPAREPEPVAVQVVAASPPPATKKKPCGCGTCPDCP